MKYLLAICLLLAATGARADQIWSYTGSNMDGQGWPGDARQSCSCNLTGTVTFNSAWQAVAWDFTADGVTLTQANSTGLVTAFDPLLHNTVPLAGWDVELVGDGYILATEFAGGIQDGDSITKLDGTGILGIEQGQPGQWALVNTPEPGTWALLLVGLAALALIVQGAKYQLRPTCPVILSHGIQS